MCKLLKVSASLNRAWFIHGYKLEEERTRNVVICQLGLMVRYVLENMRRVKN